eukprot:9750823-Lingulodinium_polyedra.AAC.1
MHSPLFDAVARCDAAGEVPNIEPEELHTASSLWLLEELVGELDGAAGRLAKVTLRTRGNL